MDPSQLEGNNGTTFSHQLQETGSYVGLLWPRGCCCCCCLLAKSCLTLCDTVDCSPPGTSVHEMLQARILEWIAISCSRGSSRLGDPTHVSGLAGRFVTTELPGKPHDPGKRYSKHLFFFWTDPGTGNSVSSHFASLAQQSAMEHQSWMFPNPGTPPCDVLPVLAAEAAVSSPTSYSWAAGSVALSRMRNSWFAIFPF